MARSCVVRAAPARGGVRGRRGRQRGGGGGATRGSGVAAAAAADPVRARGTRAAYRHASPAHALSQGQYALSQAGFTER